MTDRTLAPEERPRFPEDRIGKVRRTWYQFYCGNCRTTYDRVTRADPPIPFMCPCRRR
jgi:hypothetical protein